jgi:thiol:disulfide interchange protein DsbD
MKTTSFFPRRWLAAAVCAGVAWWAVQGVMAKPPGQGKDDQAVFDPFSDMHRALPYTTQDGPVPGSLGAANPMRTRSLTGASAAFGSPALAAALFARQEPVQPNGATKDTSPPPKVELDPNWKQKPEPADPKDIKDVIDFAVIVTPKEGAKRGQTVRVTVVGMPVQHWHSYAMTIKAPDQTEKPGRFKFTSNASFAPLPPVEESKPQPFADPKDKAEAWVHGTRFTWSFDVLIKEDAKPGLQEFPFVVDVQVCKNSCLNGNFELRAPITVQPGEVPVTPELKKRSEEKFPPPKIVKLSGEVVTEQPTTGGGDKTTSPGQPSKIIPMASDHQASMDRVLKVIEPFDSPDRDVGLAVFLLAGMFWGFVSLITPCVFPMIPITVSYFLKQSEKQHHKPVTMALVYCGTIVVVLTIAAAALLNFFRVLSINPLMNYGLGILFIVFALSLFGMYDIELPSFMGRFTSEREGKGGLVGTIFMALTFTIISFACVAPFLGGFGGTAATVQRPWWHTVLGGLAFSVTFASPFFILALFPTLLKRLPKSGAWLNSVKVVMGFLELAAAFKFFRAGELVMGGAATNLFTYDLVLGLWIALCVLCGLYLLGLYRLPHDSPVENLSVPRMLFAFLFLGLGFYLTPALFGAPTEEGPARPAGAVYAWINSFLLPEGRPGTGGEVWSGNLEGAIAEAKEYELKTGKRKLIFVDFTGATCTNCKKNERNVFSKGEIRKLFQPYALVQLYTDAVPVEFYAPEDQAKIRSGGDSGRQVNDAEVVNAGFQKKVFNDAKLPLYAILEPLPSGKVRVVGVYTEGLINDEAAFAEFLRKPQKEIGGVARAGS